MQRATLILLSMGLGLGSMLGCGDHEPGLPTPRTYDVRPVVDGGMLDAGSTADAATPDASTESDAGTELDAGTEPDTGADAASPDGLPDAGTPLDAGLVDARTPDASVPAAQWVAADTLVAATVRAGDALSVTCLLEDSAQRRIVAAVTQTSALILVPANAATTREDGTLVPTRAGDLAVACSFPGLGLLDATPAIVKVLPANAARTVASLDRGSITAGQSVTVSCSVFDAFDNPITGLSPTLRSSPFDGKNALGSGLSTFERAGTFEIHCDLGGAGSVPAKLEVLPALPATLTVARVPDKSTYARGEVIEFARAVADRYGNPITDANVPVVSVPAGTQVGDGRFSYSRAGTYRLTASVAPPTEGGVTLSKSVELLVDGTGPNVNCDFPLDGEVLNLLPGGKLVFRGSASDPSGIKEVRVNGTIRSVDAAGHFTAELTSRFGLNFIELESLDNGERQTKRICAFLLANRWIPDGAMLDDGLSFWLRQAAVDDSSRSDLDSLGDVLDAVLASSSLRDTIHSAFSANSVLKSGCDQTLLGRCVLSSQITYQDTRIAGPNSSRLALVENGLASNTRISNLAVELRLDGDLLGLTYQNVGWINFESIDVDTTFDIGISTGRPRATVRPGSTTTTVGRITTEFSGIEGEILALAVDFANGILREYVAMRVQAFVTENLNGVLDGIVSSLDASVFGTNINVARFDGTGAIPTEVDTQFSSLSTSSNRMLFGMGTSFVAPPLPTKPATGAPVAETVRALERQGTEPLGVAIHEALFNQALYALWRAGYFDATLNDRTPGLALSEGMVVTFSTRLPPVAVLRDNRVELSLGGVEASISDTMMFPLPVPMALGARASMAVRLEGGALVFDDFVLDETHLALDAPDLDPTFRSLIEQALPGMLGFVVGDALRSSIPPLNLPTFTLPPTAASYGLPAGAQFGMTKPALKVDAPRLFLLGEPAFW